MLRTIVTVAILIGTTFFLPVWVQLVCYAIALFFVKYRWSIIIPALFADAWYAPTRALFSLQSNRMTLIALGMVIVFTVVVTSTRISQRYGLEKK